MPISYSGQKRNSAISYNEQVGGFVTELAYTEQKVSIKIPSVGERVVERVGEKVSERVGENLTDR